MVWRTQFAFAPPGAMFPPVAEESSSPTPLPLASKSTLKYFRTRGSFAGISKMCGTRREPGSGGRFLKKPPTQPTADLERYSRTISSSSSSVIFQPEREKSALFQKISISIAHRARSRRGRVVRDYYTKWKRPEGHHTFKPLTSFIDSQSTKTASMVVASIYQTASG